jgi:hypothetical protein
LNEIMKAIAQNQTSIRSSTHQRSKLKRVIVDSVHGFATFKPGVTALQRKPKCACGGGCPRCQGGLPIQTKLRIGTLGDRYEQEADRVADQVMRMPEPLTQPRESDEDEEELIQTKPVITHLVHRQAEPEDKEEGEETIQAMSTNSDRIQHQVEPEEQEEEVIQTSRVSGSRGWVNPNLEIEIRHLKGLGQPLPQAVRNYFEPRFGYDFSDVRVHTGGKAARIARAAGAQAFTFNNEIVFGAGHYIPQSLTGRKLLGHELVHVQQQNECKKGNSPNNSKIMTKGTPQKMKDKTKRVNISLQFDGHKLSVKGSHSYSFPANSGLKTVSSKNKTGIDFTKPGNMKKYQDLADLGPIPEGKYYAKTKEVECHSRIIKKAKDIKCPRSFSGSIRGWGLYRTRLYESFLTSLSRKRKGLRTGGFFLHQDRGNDGTAGCIGLIRAKDNRILHRLLTNNLRDEVPVFVTYKETPKKKSIKKSTIYKKVDWTSFTKDFIVDYSQELKTVAKKDRVHPIAIAGVVAWEREKNPRGYWSDVIYQERLCHLGTISKEAGIGYGSIHLNEAEKMEKLKKIKPAKNIRERCLRLLNPLWAIFYIAKIMNSHAFNYARFAKELIRRKPEILATLYHTGKSKEKAQNLWKRKVDAKKKGLKSTPKPKPDNMGRWILENKKTLKSLIDLGSS